MRLSHPVASLAVVFLLGVSMETGPASASDDSSCPVGFSVYDVDESQACGAWPDPGVVPDICDYTASLEPMLQKALIETKKVTVPGNDASLSLCGVDYTFPRGVIVDACAALGRIADVLRSNVGPTVEVVEEAQAAVESLWEDWSGELGCSDGPAPVIDLCGVQSTITSKVPAMHANQTISIPWLLNATGTGWILPQPGHPITIPLPVEVGGQNNFTLRWDGDWEVLNTVNATWVPYQPYGQPFGPDPCPMPWPDVMRVQVPDCALPPQGWNPVQDLAAYVEQVALYCGWGEEASPELMAYLRTMNLWLNTTLNATNHGTGMYVYNEAWKKAHLEYEAPSLDWTRDMAFWEPPTSGGQGGQSATNWRIDIVPEVGSVPDSTLGGVDVGTAFSAYQLGNIQFQDEGTTSQGAQIFPDTLNLITPPTRAPPDAWDKAVATASCVGMAAGIVGAAAVAIAGTFGTGGFAVFAGLALVTTVSVAAPVICIDMGEKYVDEGYIKCDSRWEVWHGPDNNVAAEGKEIGPLLLTGFSEGDGNDTKVFREPWFPYEQEGYHAGLEECKNRYEELKTAVRAYYRNWQTTNGEGSASLTLSLPLLDGIYPKPIASDALRTLDEDLALFFDQNSGLLFVGCQEDGCPMDLQVIVESHCGTQVLTPTESGAQYTFEAGGECTTVTITIHGYTVTVGAPLSVNVHSKAMGTRHE